ncbi:MAG TPA: hypothetical protein VK986_24395 [Tepidisphaeraceae bacterium]|nr:hypothetical protein [Tepidisphaeraceae bacterium]
MNLAPLLPVMAAILLGTGCRAAANDPEYVRAEIRQGGGAAVATREWVVTDRGSVERIVSLFPRPKPEGAPKVGGWIRSIRVKLVRADGTAVTISTNGKRFDSPWGEWPMTEENRKALAAILTSAKDTSP